MVHTNGKKLWRSKGFLASLAGTTVLALLASLGAGRLLERYLALPGGATISSQEGGHRSVSKSATSPAHGQMVLSRRSYMDSIVKRNIFDSSAVGVSVVEDMGNGEEGRRTDLKATLLATVAAVPEESSSALIATGEKSSTVIQGYGINDELLGEAVIIKILPRKVLLRRNDGSIEYLDMGEEGVTSKGKSSSPEEKADDGITKLGEDSYAVDADFLDQAIANVDSLVTQVRAIPHRGPDGEIDGYRLSSIRRNSLLYKLGIKNGDIIHSVNGKPLVSASGALNAYQNLQSERSFTFEITRRNQKKTLEYEVR